MPLKVGKGLAVICRTERDALGRGETAAREVHRATWSTGTMLMVLLMSGTSPNCTHPLTIRQMKSSVLVTEEPIQLKFDKEGLKNLPAVRESPTTYPGRTMCPLKPLRPASKSSFSETHLVWP